MVVLLAFLAAGCTGSFNLTKKVYDFHRSQSDKWADELCFLLVAITPVYSFATFADAIVFNSIEFWTGDNPVAYNPDLMPATKLVRHGDDELMITYDRNTDQITITPRQASNENIALTLERNDEMVLARNENGDVIYSSMKNDGGDISIYDGQGELVKNFSPAEIGSFKEALSRD